MRHHRVYEGAVVEAGIAETEISVGCALFAEEVARGNTGAFDQLFEQRTRRRRFQIFDDMRLDAGVADHRERVARRAAFGVVVDDDVGRHSADSASLVEPSVRPISLRFRSIAIPSILSCGYAGHSEMKSEDGRVGKRG